MLRHQKHLFNSKALKVIDAIEQITDIAVEKKKWLLQAFGCRGRMGMKADNGKRLKLYRISNPKMNTWISRNFVSMYFPL